MILVIKGIFTYFLVAPLGIGVSNSNGGKNEAVALVIYTAVVRIIKGFVFYSTKIPFLRGVGGALIGLPHPFKLGSK